MIFRPSPTPAASLRSRTGFSLVEVTLAIGLLAFCLIPLMGLIPTGLNAQHSAAERVLAVDALTMMSTAVYSSQFVSRDATTGAVTYRLPQYLCDNALPATNPTTYTSGQAASTHAYAMMDDGSIRKTGDTRNARQTMFVKIFPPATPAQIASLPAGTTPTPSSAVRVYVLVAWPAVTTDTTTMAVDQLKNRQGFLESYITYVPNN